MTKNIPRWIYPLREAIQLREDFVETTPDGIYKEGEWYNTYHAFEFLGRVVVFSEFSCPMEDHRQFLIYDVALDTLREATNFEDSVFRYADDEEPFRDMEGAINLHFIICRDHEGKVSFA